MGNHGYRREEQEKATRTVLEEAVVSGMSDGKLPEPPERAIQLVLKPGGWKDYEVSAIGTLIVLKLNGTVTVD